MENILSFPRQFRGQDTRPEETFRTLEASRSTNQHPSHPKPCGHHSPRRLWSDGPACYRCDQKTRRSDSRKPDEVTQRLSLNNLKSFLQNRNFILILSLILGLLWGKAAQWTEGVTLPALAIVMTISTMSVPRSVFRSFRDLLAPAIAGIVMNYLILGTLLLGLNALLIHDEALKVGFVIIAAVPPAIAVIPFTFF